MKERGNGIECPSCSHHLSTTLETRRMVGWLYRRRKCLKCGWRFSTTELYLPPQTVQKKSELERAEKARRKPTVSIMGSPPDQDEPAPPEHDEPA